MSLSAPPLTVALLTYNRLHYLKESIAGILGQSYQNFELLVLDNCSTDDTGEFVLSLQDPRIRYVRNAANLSSVQFNGRSAYHIALGQRIIVTHDDDIMEPDMLERQMRFLDAHPEVRLVWTRVSDIDQDGRPISGKPTTGGADRIFGPGEYITSFLKERLWPMPSGVMLELGVLPRMYSLQACFRNDTSLKKVMEAAGMEDVLLPARINRKSAIAYIDKPMLRRRVHTNQISHSLNLSLPAIHLYRGLKRVARGVPALQSHVLHFDAFVTRFEIQEAITTHEGETVGKGTLSKIGKAAARLRDNIEQSPDAFLAGLPIFLLDTLLTNAGRFHLLEALQADKHDSATRKLLAWARQGSKAPDSSILEPLGGRRIIVFGSAFIAALLILEARKNDARVVACIDSNVNRQGRKLLGVPIQPLAWMREHVEAGDVVVISSERDHEHYIKAIVRQHLQAQTRIVSWKDLLG